MIKLIGENEEGLLFHCTNVGKGYKKLTKVFQGVKYLGNGIFIVRR